MNNILTAWREVVAKDIVLSIIHRYDNETDLDEWYGKFSDNASGEYYVDRKEGLLRGSRKTWVETFPTEQACDERWAELEALDFGVESVFTAVTVQVDEVDVDGNPVLETHHFTDKDEYRYEDFWRDLRRDFGWSPSATESRTEWAIEISGDEILADGLPTRYDFNTYRYMNFVDDYGTCPPKSWGELTPEEQAEYLEVMKSAYQRAHDYFMQRWGYIGIEVEIHWKGEEIGAANTWGIEDDMNAVDLEQYELELIDEAIDEAIRHFERESRKYDMLIQPPAVLVEWASQSLDDRKPLRDKVRMNEGAWHPSYRGHTLFSSETTYGFASFLNSLDDEQAELYTGKVSIDDVESNQ